MRKELENESKKVVKQIELAYQDFQNTINPCPICNHKTESYDEICLSCCWYYGSNFELQSKV